MRQFFPILSNIFTFASLTGCCCCLALNGNTVMGWSQSYNLGLGWWVISHSRPIRGQYSGHMIILNQSEANELLCMNWDCGGRSSNNWRLETPLVMKRVWRELPTFLWTHVTPRLVGAAVSQVDSILMCPGFDVNGDDVFNRWWLQ